MSLLSSSQGPRCTEAWAADINVAFVVAEDNAWHDSTALEREQMHPDTAWLL